MRSDKIYGLFFWVALAPVLVVFIAAYPAYLYFGGPVGGLTRIGFWPERDYLQRLKQEPVVLVANSVKTADADVVVIGDSFALGHVWQSVASHKTGLIFQTHGYPNGKDCFADWIKKNTQAIVPSGKSKTLILETVERAFMWRIKELSACDDKVVYPLPEVSANELWRVGTVSAFGEIDMMRQLQTIKNQIQLVLWPERKLGNAARNVALVDATLFSNLRPDRLLYLNHDENRLDWTEEDIQKAILNLKAVQLDIAGRGYRFMVLIVPDKVHVYEDVLVNPWPEHPGKDVAKNLREAGLEAPDLLHALKHAVKAHQDIYLPNDTHTSESGYRVIGTVVAQALKIR